MANKILNTVLKLRYDTYENWTANKEVVLQAGEAGVVYVPADSGSGMNEPAVLVKIGDGTTTWENLSYISALAGNVLPRLTGNNPTLPATSIEGLEDFIAGEIQDTNTRYRLTADGAMGVKLQSSETGSDPWSDVGAAITLDPTANITAALAQLNLTAVTASQGQIISSISQTNGKVSAETRALVAADIPEIGQEKVTGLTAALAGKQDSLTFDGTYNAESNKVATQTTVSTAVSTAISALDADGETAGTGEVISAVSEADGVITVQKKTLTEADIPALSISKVTNLQTTLDGKQATVVWNTAYDAGSNKAATMADVTNAVAGLSGAMHYVGESTTDPATDGATVEGHEDWAAGDVVVYQNKEFVFDGENWRELGDESSFAVKGSIKDADIAADAAIAQSKIANLTTDLASKATPADITSAIEALDVASTSVTTGNKITAIEQVDGKISVTTGAITAGDIPELAQSKITGLETDLAAIEGDIADLQTAIGEGGSVADAISAAIGALDVTDTAVEKQFVTAVSETDGKVAITRRALTADDIPEIATSKVTGLDTTLSGINGEIDALQGLVGETAVSTQITTALDALDAAAVTAGQGEILETVSQENGLVSITKRNITVNDLPTLPTSKISGLGYFATGTDATHLSLENGSYLILNGGNSQGF